MTKPYDFENIILIIAGGRDYKDEDFLYEKINQIHSLYKVKMVVSGRAKGADRLGEAWANYHGVPVDPYPAKWDDLSAPKAVIKYGTYGPYNTRAGHDRNAVMASKAQAVALFPGGKGTQNMHDCAIAAGIVIFDFRGEEKERKLF